MADTKVQKTETDSMMKIPRVIHPVPESWANYFSTLRPTKADELQFKLLAAQAATNLDADTLLKAFLTRRG